MKNRGRSNIINCKKKINVCLPYRLAKSLIFQALHIMFCNLQHHNMILKVRSSCLESFNFSGVADSMFLVNYN